MTGKIAFITDSKGTLLDHVLRTARRPAGIDLVVCDGRCGSADVADRHGVEVVIIEAVNNRDFSDRLMATLDDFGATYGLVTISRLFTGPVLEAYKNRLFNLHPALLPSFKGMNAFARAAETSVTFVGDTYHVIDETVDGGDIIMQAVAPFDGVNTDIARHRMFENECRMTIQMLHWLAEKRISLNEKGRPVVRDAIFQTGCISPNLEAHEAIEFSIPR